MTLNLMYFIPQGNITTGDKLKVELVVDGKKIPMNKFVQKIVGSTILGMIATLDDVEPGNTIEVRIDRGE